MGGKLRYIPKIIHTSIISPRRHLVFRKPRYVWQHVLTRILQSRTQTPQLQVAAKVIFECSEAAQS